MVCCEISTGAAFIVCHTHTHIDALYSVLVCTVLYNCVGETLFLVHAYFLYTQGGNADMHNWLTFLPVCVCVCFFCSQG